MKPDAPFRLKAYRPHITENHVELACLAILRRRNYWPARLHAGTFRSVDGKRWIKGVEKGTPDWGAIHADYPGFLLETKRPGNKTSPEQECKQWELRAGFHLAIAVVASDAELARWLDEHEALARDRWRRLLTTMPRAP